MKTTTTINKRDFDIIHCVELFQQKGFTYGDACSLCFKAKKILMEHAGVVVKKK